MAVTSRAESTHLAPSVEMWVEFGDHIGISMMLIVIIDPTAESEVASPGVNNWCSVHKTIFQKKFNYEVNGNLKL